MAVAYHYSAMHSRERTIIGSVSYRNDRIGYFVSADIMCNAAGSAAVNGLHYTGDQRAVAQTTTTIREEVEGAGV